MFECCGSDPALAVVDGWDAEVVTVFVSDCLVFIEDSLKFICYLGVGDVSVGESVFDPLFEVGVDFSVGFGFGFEKGFMFEFFEGVSDSEWFFFCVEDSFVVPVVEAEDTSHPGV